MNKKQIKFTCPTCGKEIEWNDKYPYRPFCCKRCQLIDLGGWICEENKIPADNEEGEIDIP